MDILSVDDTPKKPLPWVMDEFGRAVGEVREKGADGVTAIGQWIFRLNNLLVEIKLGFPLNNRKGVHFLQGGLGWTEKV